MALDLEGPLTADAAARSATTARELLKVSRRRLAEATNPDSAPVLTEPGWIAANRVLQAHRDSLAEEQGVVGFGPSRRRRGGRETDEQTITVYVTKKLSPSALRRSGRKAVPEVLSAGRYRPVPTDVVELGELELLVDVGCTVDAGSVTGTGSLGALAVDRFTRQPVALTAMHVTGIAEYWPGDGPTIEFRAPCESARSQHIGYLLEGTQFGVDAAKISISQRRPPSHTIRGGLRIRGWRPLGISADRDALVRLAGAVTKVAYGKIRDPLVYLPKYELGASVLVDIHAAPGDSGAAMVDNAGLVLGLLVGRSNSHESLKVFSPIGAVLHRLNCDIPTDEES